MTLLPWHREPAELLARRAAENRLPHGLLLTAPEGWGEQILANWLALHLLGMAQDRTAEELAHPDLRWLKPDGAVVKIDEVRTMADFAVGTPQKASCKVAVLSDADCMNRNAANALLKTLEEPPPGTYLLLTSCHPGRLPATVRSRCQVVAVRPDEELARRWLQQTVDADDLDMRIFEHGGAPLAVVEGLARGEMPLAGLLTEALATRQPGVLVQQLLEQGLVRVTSRWYRYLVPLAAGRMLVSGPALNQALAGVSGRLIAQFAEEMLWARRQLVSSNSANERLLAERLLYGWRSLVRGVSVTA